MKRAGGPVIMVGKPDECWLFNGALIGGYGTITVKGQQLLVHRVVYEDLVGPIPDGMVIHHLCGNKACANFRHLCPLSPALHRQVHVAMKLMTSLHGQGWSATRIARRVRLLSRGEVAVLLKLMAAGRRAATAAPSPVARRSTRSNALVPAGP